MGATQHGVKLWFGIDFGRELPKGFVSIQSPKSFAKAREIKTGRMYFVSPTENGGLKLTRCRYWTRRTVARALYPVKIGQPYMDTSDTMEFREKK